MSKKSKNFKKVTFYLSFEKIVELKIYIKYWSAFIGYKQKLVIQKSINFKYLIGKEVYKSKINLLLKGRISKL